MDSFGRSAAGSAFKIGSLRTISGDRHKNPFKATDCRSKRAQGFSAKWSPWARLFMEGLMDHEPPSMLEVIAFVLISLVVLTGAAYLVIVG